MPKTPLTTNDCTSCRHKWEVPLVWLSGIVTLLAIMGGIAILVSDTSTLAGVLSIEKETIETYGLTMLALVIAPIGIYIFRFYMAAKARANAILVGPKQFPEIWKVYEELCYKLNMTVLPKLYITNGNGTVNAYALSCNKRHNYVVLHSEIALLMTSDPDIVTFVLAHELAHHKLGHTSLYRNVITIIGNVLPPFGLSVTRAQEYSADRLAMKVFSEYASSMKLLAAGPWIQNKVDTDEWLQQAQSEQGEFYVRVANLLSGHAVLVKRVQALRDIEVYGFSKHGSMF